MESSKTIEYNVLLQCPICMEQYQEPKALPCYHLFCLHCLEQYVDSRQETLSETSRRLPCPICRQDFTVPPAGCRDLHTIYFPTRRSEFYQAAAKSGSETTCDVCEIKSTVGKTINQYCVECQQTMCVNCAHVHKKMTVSKSHQVKVLDRQVLKDVLKVRTSHCEQHPNELISLFCKQCSVPICFMCFVLKHVNHGCDDIKNVTGNARNDTDITRKVIVESQPSAQLPERCRDLDTIFFLARLGEQHQTAAISGAETACEVCNANSIIAVGAVNQYCVECRQTMCGSCAQSGHKTITISKSNQITVLVRNVLEEVLSIRTSYCDHHPEDLISLFCAHCLVPICFKCFALTHADHSCEDITEVAERGRIDIDQAVKLAAEKLESEEEFGQNYLHIPRLS